VLLVDPFSAEIASVCRWFPKSHDRDSTRK